MHTIVPAATWTNTTQQASKMRGGGGLSKLGVALTIIFVVSLAALLAELFYVLWRRRVFRREANTIGGGGDQLSQYSTSESAFSPIASSKELLYFFCIRPQSRLEQNAVTDNTTTNGVSSNQQSEIEVIDIDLMKIQGMFGPPRFLFTIKEEEREDLDSSAEKSNNPCSGRQVKKTKERSGVTRVSLEDCFKATEESVVAVEIDDATPFTTPCASPLYFTPSASPINYHDVVNDSSTREGGAPIVRSEL